MVRGGGSFPANWALGGAARLSGPGGTADVLSTATALSRQTEKCSQRGKVVFPDRQSAACALWEVQAAVERRAYYTKGTNEQTREVKPSVALQWDGQPMLRSPKCSCCCCREVRRTLFTRSALNFACS